MDYKIDYLRLTFIAPKNEIDVTEIRDFLFNLFELDSVKSEFMRFGGGKYYEYRLTYKNIITVYVPHQFDHDLQGFMIQFSGQGISWYESYMTRIYRSFKGWKKVLAEFFSFSDLGYDCRCNRIDIAFDDILKVGENRKPLLDLNKIEKSLKNGEFVSLFKKDHPRTPLLEAYKEEERARGKVLGTTLNVGNRNSDAFLRFYDKLMEQKSKKNEIDEDIIHWTRMEFEFHNKRALALCDSLICLSDNEFSAHLSKIVNRYISFREVRGALKSNYYRCPQKKWWTKIVGTLDKARLVCNKAYVNHYQHTLNDLRRRIYPTLWAILQCQSVDEFLVDIKQYGYERQNKSHTQIINDFINGFNDEQKQKGYEVHKETCEDYETLLGQLQRTKMKNEIRMLRKKLCNVGDMEEVFEKLDKTTPEGLGANLSTYNCKIDDYKTVLEQEWEYCGMFA